MTDKPDQASETFLRIALDSIPLRIFWKDCDLNFLGANQQFVDDVGFKDLEDCIGKCDYDIFKTKEEAEQKRDDDREVIRTGLPKLDIEEPLAIEGKKLKWLRTNKVPIRDADGKIFGVLGTYEDITEQVHYREQIEEQAFLDPLTGLANRRKLRRQIRAANFDYSGLLFIDLDHFKHVNDTLGHLVGDHVLQRVAERLTGIADKNNAFLARLGGDEFSIFKVFDSLEDAESQLEIIAKEILDAFKQPFEVKQHTLYLGASIGITFVDGKTTEVNYGFIEADIAMYAAKAQGRNTYQFFNETLRVVTKKRHRLIKFLYKAIENDELQLVYQPQFNVEEKLIGAEALLRWTNSELGTVSPAEFIPIAEETGLIHSIGDWVIDSAIDTLKSWRDLTDQNPDFKLSINTSAIQFQNIRLASSIFEKTKIKGLRPENLSIEITESVLFDPTESNTQAIVTLKEKGFSVAIDDFGTGYSSLSKLSQLPIDTLKIDQSFVRDIDKNETNEKLVQAIINMARQLDMDVIAEGVEHAGERGVLERLGCFQFQGYMFSRPISLEKFNDIFR